MSQLIKKIKDSFSTYTKENVDSPNMLYHCKCIQIWKLRISWYSFIEYNDHLLCGRCGVRI